MNPTIHFYDTIARFYDAENAQMMDDLALYVELAEDTGGPVLDVGCGTGRVMLHLAQELIDERLQVVGVDQSEAMLARGRRRLAALPDLKEVVTFVQGDALTVPLEERFNLILMPYNGFMHFKTQADQLAALRHFYTLLAADGLLVLDLPNAGEAFATAEHSALVLERLFTEPESGHLVMQQSMSRLDRARQQLHVTWIYDEIMDDGAVHRTLAPLVLRYVFPGEMDLLLAATGFEAIATYGDYFQNPFEDGGERMIVLASKAGA